jgi:hypothetical protein
MEAATTHPANAGERKVPMTSTTIPTTSYGEACDHAEAQYLATNGLVAGGGYMVRFDDGTVAEVELRIVDGIARPLR